jgi:hypothetical protein
LILARLPEFTAAYSLRLVINHNPRRQLKAVARGDHTWQLQEFELGDEGHNLNFRIRADQGLMFRFDPGSLQLEMLSNGGSDSLEPGTKFSSYELNGFVWGDLVMFRKFNASMPDRSFVRHRDDLWSIDVPLRHNVALNDGKGNPPPLEFTPINTGFHRFFADVVAGADAVNPL